MSMSHPTICKLVSISCPTICDLVSMSLLQHLYVDMTPSLFFDWEVPVDPTMVELFGMVGWILSRGTWKRAWHTQHTGLYSSAPSNSSWLKMSAQDSHTDQESHVFKIRPMNQKWGEAITSSCSPPKSPKFSSEPPFSPTLSMQGETYLLSIPFQIEDLQDFDWNRALGMSRNKDFLRELLVLWLGDG